MTLKLTGKDKIDAGLQPINILSNRSLFATIGYLPSSGQRFQRAQTTNVHYTGG